MKLHKILFILCVFSFISIAVNGLLYYFSLKSSAANDSKIKAIYHCDNINNLISSYLQENQKAIHALAGIPELEQALTHPDETTFKTANQLLDHINDSLHSSVTYLMDATGKTIASSNRNAPDSFVGKNYSFRPYFIQAMAGKPAIYLALGVTSNKRGVYYSHPIQGQNSLGPTGSMVVKADISIIEDQWLTHQRYTPGTFTFITGPHDIVFLSDHQKFLYQLLWPLSAKEKLTEGSFSEQFGKGPWEWAGFKQKDNNHAVDKDGNIYLMVSKAIPLLPGWTVVHLQDMKNLSHFIAAPFLDIIGYIVLITSIFIGLSVYFLYTLGKKDIVRRKLSEEALQEALHTIERKNRRLDGMFRHHAAIMLIIDPIQHGRILDANNAALAFYGYSYDEITTLGITDINKLTVEKVDEEMIKALENRKNIFNFKHRIKNGDIRSVEVHSTPILANGKKILFSIIHDITEKVKFQEALQNAHERFLKVLNSIDATVYVSDMNTNEILFMNQGMIETFGRDMTGEICWKVFRGENDPCPHCKNTLLTDESGKPSDVQIWQDKNPITGRWYINHDRAIEWIDGRIVKLQIATDITEMKLMEEKLRQAYKMESIGTLTGGIAHDFNNILYMIIGNAELAMEDIPESNAAQINLEEIRAAGLRAAGIVKQLLNFSRKSNQDLYPVEPIGVIKEAVKFLRSTIPATIEIQSQIQETEIQILADPIQIHQVLINICTNSFQAMEDTGGQLEISAGMTSLFLDSDQNINELANGDYFKITIRDTGPGIDSDIIHRVFDPYFTTKAFGEGSGMGLATALGIVKNHHGTIKVQNHPDKGAVFTIFLPIINETPVKDSGTGDKIPMGNESIFFIDDEAAITQMTKKILERLGYSVETCLEPLEALTLFQSKPQAFDLVISDMTMPQMTGIQLTQKLKEIRPDIPVIICSGHSTMIHEKKLMHKQISAFVTKPIEKKTIAATIRKILDQR